MKKEKIAFVVCRYGEEIIGGAEYSCRMLAERLTSLYKVDILTTCAKRNDPWDNFYAEGVSVYNDVEIRRFPIKELFGNREGDWFEDEWIKKIGPYSPTLIEFIRENATEYKKIIFVTYAIYPTVAGLKLGLDNAVLMPTAHDEPQVYRKIYEQVFTSAKGFIYHSEEEKEFVVDKFNVGGIPSCNPCVGFELGQTEHGEFARKYDNYIIYVGRVCNGKNYPQLNKYFIEYKRRNPSNLKLLVVGAIENNLHITTNNDIVYLGFVSEDEKNVLIKNAGVLCMPSKYESLSWVLIESMALQTPVLVNEECKVMKGQCIRSNAGLYYSNYLEFEKCLNFLLAEANTDICLQMGQNGKKYVEETYSWEKIIRNIVKFLDEEI